MDQDNQGMCKHQIKDKAKSTWNNDVFRNCKLRARRDGYCDTHHPENIAMELERAGLADMVRGIREAEKCEEATVGAYLRIRRRDEFNAILAEIRDAEELQRQLNASRFR